ncbi:hypothetical protein [Bacillus sp. FJAT-27916]|uniref:hypothetical protein n=1 Tax=Bacillus sp. FJAT-27916 TaxID=1679169 RepID=UPI00069DFE0C|nr:hypothetical protein [Bacillus sp. FJAT-27916]
MSKLRSLHGRYRIPNKNTLDIKGTALTDGVYAIPRDPEEYRVKVRALDAYCRERGMEPKQLTEKEMEQFLVDPMAKSR